METTVKLDLAAGDLRIRVRRGRGTAVPAVDARAAALDRGDAVDHVITDEEGALDLGLG